MERPPSDHSWTDGPDALGPIPPHTFTMSNATDRAVDALAASFSISGSRSPPVSPSPPSFDRTFACQRLGLHGMIIFALAAVAAGQSPSIQYSVSLVDGAPSSSLSLIEATGFLLLLVAFLAKALLAFEPLRTPRWVTASLQQPRSLAHRSVNDCAETCAHNGAVQSIPRDAFSSNPLLLSASRGRLSRLLGLIVFASGIMHAQLSITAPTSPCCAARRLDGASFLDDWRRPVGFSGAALSGSILTTFFPGAEAAPSKSHPAVKKNLTLCTSVTNDDLTSAAHVFYSLEFRRAYDLAHGLNATVQFFGSAESTTKGVVRAFVVNGTHCDGVLGPGWSTRSIALSPVTDVPWLDHSATSVVLSNKAEHPSFSRVIPADDSGALLGAAFFRQHKIKRVLIVCENDAYGRSLAAKLEETMRSEDDAVPVSHCIEPSASESDVLSLLKSSLAGTSSINTHDAIYIASAGVSVLFRYLAAALLAENYHETKVLFFSETACSTAFDDGASAIFAGIPGAFCASYSVNETTLGRYVSSIAANKIDWVASVADKAATFGVVINQSDPSLTRTGTFNAFMYDAVNHMMESMLLVFGSPPTTTTVDPSSSDSSSSADSNFDFLSQISGNRSFYGSESARSDDLKAQIALVRRVQTSGASGVVALNSNGDRVHVDAVFYNVAARPNAAPIVNIIATQRGGLFIPNASQTLYVLGRYGTIPLFNTQPTGTGTSDNVTPAEVALVAIGTLLVGLLIVAVSGSLLWFCVLNVDSRAKKYAPSNETAPFAIAFTDIQASTTLWARGPEVMSDAVDCHHRTIRAMIAKHKGYEVKTIGDAFMAAFKTAKSAALFAAEVQVALYEGHEWDEAVDEIYKDLTGDNAPWHEYALIWNGIRVRVGVNYGLGKIVEDEVSGTFDFYGTVVNTAARVENVSQGGHTVVTEAVLLGVAGKWTPESTGAAEGKNDSTSEGSSGDGGDSESTSRTQRRAKPHADAENTRRESGQENARKGSQPVVKQPASTDRALSTSYDAAAVASLFDKDSLPDLPGITITPLGPVELRGLQEPVVLYELLPDALAERGRVVLRVAALEEDDVDDGFNDDVIRSVLGTSTRYSDDQNLFGLGRMNLHTSMNLLSVRECDSASLELSARDQAALRRGGAGFASWTQSGPNGGANGPNSFARGAAGSQQHQHERPSYPSQTTGRMNTTDQHQQRQQNQNPRVDVDVMEWSSSMMPGAQASTSGKTPLSTTADSTAGRLKLDVATSEDDRQLMVASGRMSSSNVTPHGPQHDEKSLPVRMQPHHNHGEARSSTIEMLPPPSAAARAAGTAATVATEGSNTGSHSPSHSNSRSRSHSHKSGSESGGASPPLFTDQTLVVSAAQNDEREKSSSSKRMAASHLTLERINAALGYHDGQFCGVVPATQKFEASRSRSDRSRDGGPGRDRMGGDRSPRSTERDGKLLSQSGGSGSSVGTSPSNANGRSPHVFLPVAPIASAHEPSGTPNASAAITRPTNDGCSASTQPQQPSSHHGNVEASPPALLALTQQFQEDSITVASSPDMGRLTPASESFGFQSHSHSNSRDSDVSGGGGRNGVVRAGGVSTVGSTANSASGTPLVSALIKSPSKSTNRHVHGDGYTVAEAQDHGNGSRASDVPHDPSRLTAERSRRMTASPSDEAFSVSRNASPWQVEPRAANPLSLGGADSGADSAADTAPAASPSFGGGDFDSTCQSSFDAQIPSPTEPGAMGPPPPAADSTAADLSSDAGRAAASTSEESGAQPHPSQPHQPRRRSNPSPQRRRRSQTHFQSTHSFPLHDALNSPQYSGIIQSSQSHNGQSAGGVASLPPYLHDTGPRLSGASQQRVQHSVSSPSFTPITQTPIGPTSHSQSVPTFGSSGGSVTAEPTSPSSTTVGLPPMYRGPGSKHRTARPRRSNASAQSVLLAPLVDFTKMLIASVETAERVRMVKRLASRWRVPHADTVDGQEEIDQMVAAVVARVARTMSAKQQLKSRRDSASEKK